MPPGESSPRQENQRSGSRAEQQPQKKARQGQIAVPMHPSRGHIQQIEQQRDRQHMRGRRLSHAQQRSHGGAAVDAQAAHTDGDGSALEHETAGRVLVAKAGEEAADEQRGHGVTGSEQRRGKRGHSQSKDG
jgi:hypothetical protein